MKKKIFAICFVVIFTACLILTRGDFRGYDQYFVSFLLGDISDTVWPIGNLALIVIRLLLILSSLIFLYQAFEKEIKKLLNVDEWKARAEERKRVKREQEKAKLQAQIEENKAKLQEMEKAE